MKKSNKKRHEPLGDDEQIKALVGESIAEGEGQGTAEDNSADEGTAQTPKAEAAKAPIPEGEYIGKVLTIREGGAEFKGLCISERNTNSGKQVFIQINALVSRFFKVESIV